MEKTLTLPAYAKLNIGLDIVGRRDDGYHLVRMLMQRIRLQDTVTLEQTEEPSIRLFCDAPGVPADRRNLAYRAAELLFDAYRLPGGLRIRLEKQIPAAAGLAGGSADAAAVLCGINALYAFSLSDSELQKEALKLGADVPYCLKGITALSEGIGEKLIDIGPFPFYYVVLAKPEEGVSTKDAYAAFDRKEEVLHPDIDALLRAVAEKDRERIAREAGNVLQPVTEEAVPEVGRLIRLLKEKGASLSMMSGSGPTVFGLFEEKETAETALMAVRMSGLAAFSCLTETL